VSLLINLQKCPAMNLVLDSLELNTIEDSFYFVGVTANNQASSYYCCNSVLMSFGNFYYNQQVTNPFKRIYSL
jgi:hypothetical protein